MTDEKWRRIYEIYEAACELPEEQRAHFIETSAVDAEIRQRLVDLLHDLSEPVHTPVEEPSGEAQLEPGAQVGRYSIGKPLGQGGMGFVCAAFDSELRRPVALKFLRRSNIGSESGFEEFLDRVLREAQAISALNHPNIITVYDVLRVDGEAGSAKAAIVMELVEGESLRVRTGKPQPLEWVASWGLQIANGISAAHKQGIIHRDIKPENLILRSDGLIKILDFGLARQLGVDDSIEDLPMGTLGYMSPEQLRGATLGPATDVFSLGVVLWELATGNHPFRADSAIATTRAIDRVELDTSLPTSPVSGRFERLLRRLMAKNPTDRPAASVVAREFSGILDTRKRKPAVLLWTGGVAMIAAVAVAGIWRHPSSPEAPNTSPVIVPFTSYQGSETDPAFSPDGKQVAFAWTGESIRNRNIYIRGTGEEKLRQLTSGPAEDFAPVWSPDGSRLAFLRRSPESNDPLILIVPTTGGEVSVAGRIANPEGYPRPIAWWPDGQSLVVRDATDRGISLVRIRLAGGSRTVLTTPGAGESDGLPVLSPSGRHFAFVRLRVNSAAACILDLSGKVECPRTTQLEQGDSINGLIGGLAWLPDDKGLFYCDKSALWRIDFEPRAKVAKVMQGSFPGLTGTPRGGRLAFHKEYSDTNLWQLRGGVAAPMRSIGSSAEETDPAFSPDGGSLCFRSNRTGTFELWVSNSDGSGLRKLTSFGGHLGSPRWSADGRWIVFDAYGGSADKTKFTNVYVISSAGGSPRRVTTDQADCIVPNWSIDQKFIYYMVTTGAEAETWKTPFPEGPAVRVADFGMFDLAESADGRFLYYAKLRGQSGVFKRAVEGGPEKMVANTGAVHLIRYWQLDTKGIYFASGALEPRLVFLDFAKNHLRTIGPMPGTLTRGFRGLAVSPGGANGVYTSEDVILADISFIEKAF